MRTDVRKNTVTSYFEAQQLLKLLGATNDQEVMAAIQLEIEDKAD